MKACPTLASGLSLAASTSAASNLLRIVVGFPPGGPADQIGRLLVHELRSAQLDAIVENRRGASGAVAAAMVAKAYPDGRTLLLSSLGAVAISQHLRTLPYDPATDLVPITELASSPAVYVVSANSAMRTIDDLVRRSRAVPGQVAVASTGLGSTAHISIEMFSKAAAAPCVHVPYQGAAPAVRAVLGTEVAAVVADLPAVLAQIRAGAVRPLMVAATNRLAQLPDVPTSAELGFAECEAENWLGLFAPKGISAHAVQAIDAAVGQAIVQLEGAQRLGNLGFQPRRAGSPQAFSSFVSGERNRWGRRIRTAGIRGE